MNHDLPICFSEESISAHGGLELFRRYLVAIDLSPRLRQALGDVGDYGAVRMGLLVVGLLLAGGRRLAHLAVLSHDPVQTIPARHNTAVMMDTDTIFHGADRVASDDPAPRFSKGMQLRSEGGGTWCLFDGDRDLAHYDWDELRLLVSWKAYCYADEADRRRVEAHEDDLSLEHILATRCADLRKRGRLGDERPSESDLAKLLIEEYVHFPRPHAT